MTNTKVRAANNRTVTLSDAEKQHLLAALTTLAQPVTVDSARPVTPAVAQQVTSAEIIDRVIHGNLFELIPLLPPATVDLLVVDPPYNMNKTFNSNSFASMGLSEYAEWMESWFVPLLPLLKPTASIYVCGDWRSSTAIHQVLAKYVHVRNRITWEREKGRGAAKNWKNSSEDIWFATVSDEYTFNLDAVKLKRRVLAPYRDETGEPKDWKSGSDGKYRLTHPANLWTDLTVPFWSMPENTDHPTQKPEKLIAKLILASSHPGEVVLDPFLGSGTTAVVAKKLGRQYIGIELDEEYCCLALKRLATADQDNSIQGYHDGVFWERNTLNEQKQTR